MKLNQDPNWVAVHFDNKRTILKVDRVNYPESLWIDLTDHLEVDPLETKGHYKVKY